MFVRQAYIVVALVSLVFASRSASGITVTGTADLTLPSGQFMSLSMNIDDAKTTFELTGPDYSWFAFGFDTTTMFGYSLIVQGCEIEMEDDDSCGGIRTAVEQNLEGVGSPGDQQASQDITIVDTIHDDANDLTTVIIERVNDTGDPNDPIFSTSMTALDIIAAYDSFSSPESPNGVLTYHGRDGRGFGTIEFSVVPEPTSICLGAVAASSTLFVFRRLRRAHK